MSGIERVINGDPFLLTAEFASAEPLRREWELQVYRRFTEALRPGMTVLDVGASFGLYSIAAARGVGSSGRVYGFEASRRSASALRRHLDWNRVADRVEVIEAAAAERTGVATFWEQETSFVASLVEAAARQEECSYQMPVEPRRVKTLALDDFCSERELEPDVIKIDVEGSEARVLRGSRRLLRCGHALLFLELHPEFATGEGGDAGVLEQLAAAGWEWEDLSVQGATRHYAAWRTRRL
jgi:FkbM family methyltransferase